MGLIRRRFHCDRDTPSSCVAANCTNKKSGDIQLHRFPKDPVQFANWTKFVSQKRAKCSPNDRSVICSDHFAEDCYDLSYDFKADFGLAPHRKRLVKNAVRTVNKQMKMITCPLPVCPARYDSQPYRKRKRTEYFEKRERKRATFCRTSNFKYKKDELLKLAHHLYLSSTQCRSAMRCAVACLSSPGCVLADLESGNLYKQGQVPIRKTQVTWVVRNYVESLGIRDAANDTKPREVTSFLMVSEYGVPIKTRDVYKVSLNSNTTEKTGITVKDQAISIVYDRKSNTVFWSQRSGIFKQIMETHSKKIQISTGRNADNLNIYNGNLLFCINIHWQGSIYAQDVKGKNNKDLWLSVEKNRIYRLAIDGDLACWNQCRIGHSINCAETSSRKIVYTQSQPQPCRRKLSELALVKTSNYGMLVYGMKDGQAKFSIKVVEIAPGGRFGNPKTVIYFKKERRMNIFPGRLVFSVEWSRKVEIWKISQNGSIGMKTFSTRCPSSVRKSTILVALIKGI